MTPQEIISIYKTAYKEARDFQTEYGKHSMKPFIGPREFLSFWKSFIKPAPSVGYADPVPFGTKLRAFFSRTPDKVVNGVPARTPRMYAKR